MGLSYETFLVNYLKLSRRASMKFALLCAVIFSLLQIGSAGVPPTIRPFSFPKNIETDNERKVVCTATRGDKPLKFEWLKDGKKLTSEPGKIEIADVEIMRLSALNIILASSKDSANYTCLASNTFGSDQFTAQLIVESSPTWLVEPTDQNVMLGQRVSLNCTASGLPKPTTTWRRYVDPNQEALSSNGHLVIESVKEKDEGKYECESGNGIGSNIRKAITLTVRIPARFEEKFTSLSVRKGESARLTCEAKGDQPLSIAWKSQGVEFVKEGNGRYEIFETLTEKGLASELLLREVDRNDGGVYACRTENPYGSDERNIKVSVLEVPAPPLDVRTQEVWSRSVSIAWAEPYSGNSPITQYHIQYWKNYGSNHRLLEMIVPSSQPSALVKGLHPGTPYAVAVVAENSVGRSNPSDTVSFITGEEEPSGAPVDVSVKPKGTSTLQVAWKVPPKDEWNGQLTGFYVGFKVRGTSQPYSFKTVEFSGPTASHEHLLTNLRTDTEYGVVVQAFNNAGSGPPSQEVVIRTLGGDLPPPPTPFVVDTTDHSIKIQWTIGKSKSSSVAGFIVHFKKENSGWQQLPILPVSEHSYLLKDLEPMTNYQLYMTSSNDFGEGDPSTALSVRTDAIRTPVALAGNGGHLLPVFTDLSLIIPVAASIVAVLVVIIVACFWIKRVRRNTNSVLHSDPYMNGTLRSEKGYGYLPHGNGQRYVDMEKARPLTQIEATADTECLYPAPYATIPVRDETFMRKLQAANQEMKIFLPQVTNMKDRPLPNPGNETLKKDPAVYDTPQ